MGKYIIKKYNKINKYLIKLKPKIKIMVKLKINFSQIKIDRTNHIRQ